MFYQLVQKDLIPVPIFSLSYSYNLVNLLMREMNTVRKRETEQVCVHLCVCVQDTEMLMPLLWALSSTLSVSVYNSKWEKVPVIPGGLKLGENRRKTGARRALFCFGKACRADCLNTSEGRTVLTSW